MDGVRIVGLVDLGQPFAHRVDGQSMVERRSAVSERFGARHVKGIFGIEERRPDLLDALDARLRLQGYHPGIRCVVVGLGFAASYAIFCIFFVHKRDPEFGLLIVAWRGCYTKSRTAPRGVPVQWTRLLVAAAIPAINLFGQWHERMRNGGG